MKRSFVVKCALFVISVSIGYCAETPEKLYLKNGCSGCHGIYGEGIGTAPRLRGKSEKLLYERLKNLQAGKTRSPFGSVMISFAKSLDENQTKAMAKWLSTLEKKEEKEKYELDTFFDNTGDGSS